MRDADQLAAFEALSVADRAAEPLPSGRLSTSHYRAIHRHLFQDVYPWAGRYRTVRMTKDASPFCFPENIAAEMQGLFARLAADRYLQDRDAAGFVDGAATFLAYLNAIHPFREGNGRAQLTFMALLSLRAGRPLDLNQLDPAAFLQAMVASFFGDEAPLRQNLRALIVE
ncbi:MAG TPA: Fic family protein [Caulobacteraceae bacterium]|nr:Fic family protein [Caulobacteraceae bacterium]